MPMTQTRRRFLTTLAAAGAAGLVGSPRAQAAEGALETTTVRLLNDHSTCIAPVLVAEELLRAEGLTDVRYVDLAAVKLDAKTIASANFDFALLFPSIFAIAIDASQPITMLAGIHIGCFELFAREDVRSVADLKGRSVGLKSAPPYQLSLMAAQVGLDPERDIRWVTDPAFEPMERFAEGKLDAFLGFPPEPQELRARHVGHVIVNTAVDQPWSQYFCCMLAGKREFIQSKPVATKRVLRAILKATDLCATQPQRAARRIVEGGFTPHYDYALQTFQDIPYDKWREYDPEDTVRFYGLRLHETGMIKSTPQQIIADGTDWHFFNELKRELKT